MPCKEEKETLEKSNKEEVDFSKKELIIKTISMYMLALYVIIRNMWNAYLIIDMYIALFLVLVFSGRKIKKITKTELLSKKQKAILLIYVLCLCALLMKFESTYIEYINDLTSWGVESAIIQIVLYLITLICTPCIAFALYRKSKNRGEIIVWMSVFFIDFIALITGLITLLYRR